VTHEELKDKLLKCMGGKPPMAARETWAYFLKSENNCFFMSWDWIRDMRIEKWAEDHPELDCYDSPNGLTIEIYKEFRDKNGRPLGGLKGTLIDK
tara:strand:+ start:10684 stop:10968 length:285 start_codon:yes stop_codon:yes gene_type:complete